MVMLEEKGGGGGYGGDMVMQRWRSKVGHNGRGRKENKKRMKTNQMRGKKKKRKWKMVRFRMS